MIIDPPAVAPPIRKRRRLLVTVPVWVLVAPALIWAVIRLGGWAPGALVQLLAFTTYVAAWSLIPPVLALATRRWTAAGVALIGTAVLVAAVLPRVLPDRDRGPADGVRITVMTSNMRLGGADPRTIVRLVRENDVVILALQELSPDARAALTTAGLDELLPYHSLGDEPGASGSGLYSRFPITDGAVRRNGGGFRQAYGTVRVAGAGAVIVESAHPLAPSEVSLNPGWRRDLDAEPVPATDGPPRILLGDFNSTLDHAPLRRLIARGYRDAAATTGQGLVPTWPYDGRTVPKVTIDHVLVDRRIGVRDVSVHPVPDTDHRAVVAALTVTGG
nr:endonuclease/exonuclease/phosphatase family protein [Actinoplanes sp. TBRC 11911]